MSRQQYSSSQKTKRFGCLLWLLLISLTIYGLYWLLFAPLPSSGSVETERLHGDRILIDGEISGLQRNAYDELAIESSFPPQILVQEGVARFVLMSVPVSDAIAISPAEKALYFLEKNKDLFQIEDIAQTLFIEDIVKDSAGFSYVRFKQQYRGIPVYGGNMTIGVSPDGHVSFVNGGYLPNLEIDVYAQVRSTEAELMSLGDFSGEMIISSSTYLAIYNPQVFGGGTQELESKLVWLVTLSSKTNIVSNSWLYIIDSDTGSILERINLIKEVDGPIDLEIIDVEIDPNRPIMDENSLPDTNSIDANNAFKNIQTVYNYYLDTFGEVKFRKDDAIKQIKIYVNVPGCRAQWDPGKEIINICKGWSEGIDPMAHEFTHAVVSASADFGGTGDSSALNEAFADLFAAFIDDEQDAWLITNGDNEVRRDLKNTSNVYPINYNDRKFHCTKEEDEYEDCGHLNSVIFSHAAYMMDQNGVSRNKLQYIFYHALTTSLNESSTMKEAAYVVVRSCDYLKENKIYDFQPLISLDDCNTVYNAFANAGLTNVVYDVIVNTDRWYDKFRDYVRDLIDKITEDRKKIESEVQKQAENIKRALEKDFKEAVNSLIQAILLIIFVLCQSICVIAIVPLVIVILLFMVRMRLFE